MHKAQVFYLIKVSQTAFEHYWEAPISRTSPKRQPLKRFNLLVKYLKPKSHQQLRQQLANE